MSNHDPAHPNADVPVGLIVIVVILIAAAGYFLVLFFSALRGVATQLADPAAAYDVNATIFLATHPMFLGLSYLAMPEVVEHDRRLRVAAKIALVPTILLPLTIGFLLPTMASDTPWSFAAVLILDFSGVGLVPTVALARLFVLALAETRCALLDDHYIDTDALTGDTRRIIAKHTGGTFRRPLALHRLALIGDGGRLTEHDILRIIDLETNELNRLTAQAEAETRRTLAEFNANRAKLLTSISPDLALRLGGRATSAEETT